jgi:hypothetical protein
MGTDELDNQTLKFVPYPKEDISTLCLGSLSFRRILDIPMQD